MDARQLQDKLSHRSRLARRRPHRPVHHCPAGFRQVQTLPDSRIGGHPRHAAEAECYVTAVAVHHEDLRLGNSSRMRQVARVLRRLVAENAAPALAWPSVYCAAIAS